MKSPCKSLKGKFPRCLSHSSHSSSILLESVLTVASKMKTFILMILWTASLPVTVWCGDCDDLQCAPGWSRTSDRCYKVITGLPVTRRQADRECANKHQAMQEMVGGDEAFLIGLAREGENPWSGGLSVEVTERGRSTGCGQLVTNKSEADQMVLTKKADCESTSTRFVCMTVLKCEESNKTTHVSTNK